MEFLLLGPLEAHHGDVRVDLGRRRVERCLLGLLLLDANTALSLAQRAGYRLFEGLTRTVMAARHLDRGDDDAAAHAAEQAVEIQRETGYRLGVAHSLVVLGHALRRTGHADTARAHWRDALAAFTDIGVADAADEVRALLETPPLNDLGT